MARTFAEIEREIARTIQSNSNRQVDLSEGSVVRNALVKPGAGIQLRQDSRIDRLERDAFLPTAQGDALDAKGYWLERRGEAKANGFLVVENRSEEAVSLPDGAIFAQPDSNALYRALGNNGSRTVPPGLRIAVPVEAEQAGSSFNLEAGTRLVPLNQPQLDARVGDGITLDGKSCGPLQGGQDRESDETYRRRLIATAKVQTLPTTQQLEQRLLGMKTVSNAQVKTTKGGLVTVLLDEYDTLSYQDLEAIRNDLNQFLSPGASLAIKRARRINIDISITVWTRQETEQSRLSETIKAIAFNYARSIEAGTAFNPGVLERELTGIADGISVSQPAQPVSIGDSDLVYPATIRLTYVSNQ